MKYDEEVELENDIKRAKNFLISKCSNDIDYFRRVYNRISKEISEKYYKRSNKMELLILDFEEWSDIQLQLRKAD